MYAKDILIKDDDFSYNDIQGYCQELAANNPNNVPLVWICSNIALSEKGKKFMAEYSFYRGIRSYVD